MICSRQAAYAGGFDADVFYAAHEFAKNDKITDYERFVQNDGQGREQVIENTLQCERDRDTADTKTCDQGGYVDTQVLQHQQQTDGP